MKRDDESGRPLVTTSTSVREYFEDALQSAMDRQKVSADSATTHYIVGLLSGFTRSEELFENSPEGPSVRPLTSIYYEALAAASPGSRNEALRRLGDTALFISGVFADSLNRKLVDVDYYIAMGGNAYGHLSETAPATPRHSALSKIFGELAAKFPEFVDVLGELSDSTHLSSGRDILRLYEVWLRTGSNRAARRLREVGIQPSESVTSQTQH